MEVVNVVTHAMEKGLRSYQEDRYFHKRISKYGRTGYLLAVMDGHNGDTAAKTCFQLLEKTFSIRKGGDAENALRRLVDKLANVTHQFISGTCITVAYVDEMNNHVTVAVLGDCPAVVVDVSGAVNVGPVHNVRTNIQERKNAEERGGQYDLGGYIFNTKGSYGLQIGRSLGDYQMDGITSREPEVYTVKNPRFVALVTDGVLEIGRRYENELVKGFVEMSAKNTTATELLDFTKGLFELRDNATIVLWQKNVVSIW